MAVIEFDNVSKRYRLGQAGYRTFREDFLSLFKRMTSPGGKGENFIWALKDISFEVNQGEALGIIGPNGAGKTTILRLLAGITNPTTGRVVVKGRIGVLIELASGFHPELTGRENIYLNGSILGMSRKEIDRKFNSIVEFSGIEDFIDTPVKRYSTGMLVRLGFSVAAHIDPEILLVDEVLSVGDMSFQRKCLNKIEELREKETIIVFVSHNLTAVQSVCSNVLWLERGIMRQFGNTKQVINDYINKASEEIIAGPSVGVSSKRFGSQEIQINSVRLTRNGKETSIFDIGDNICIEISYRALRRIREPRFWIAICDNQGRKLAGSTSEANNQGPAWLEGEGKVSCIFSSPPFLPGVYSLIVGILDKDLSLTPYDRWGEAATFAVQVPHNVINQKFVNPDFYGVIQIKSQWKF